MKPILVLALTTTALASAACGSSPAAVANSTAAPASSTTAPVTTTASSAVPTQTAAAGTNTAGSGWCTADSLAIHADEGHSPTAANRLFLIHFTARPGVRCTIGGSLSDVVFHDAGNAALDVEIGGGQDTNYQEITLHDNVEAVVYIKAAPNSGHGLPVASIAFTLPGKGTRGATVTTAWPAPLDGPVQITNLTAPVS